MRLFKRKSSDNSSSATQDAQNYYPTQKPQRKGMAWLLAGATFIATLIVVLGLFYAGRWAYNKVNDNDSTPSEVAKPQADTSQSDGNADSDNNSDSQTQGSVSNPTDTSTNQQQTSSTNTSTPSQATTPATTGELPRTGPDQDL